MQTAVVQPHIDIHRVVAQIGDEKENLIIVVTLNEGHRHHLAHYNTAQNLINLKWIWKKEGLMCDVRIIYFELFLTYF